MASGDETHEREALPSLAAVIDELRYLLELFDEVAPPLMDARFYIHAYNELDLAGRTIIDAFDRKGRPTDDRLGQ